jgi:hypothetical protein
MRVTLFILSFVYSLQLAAQNEPANLLVQSPDGKTVKLIWFLNGKNDIVNGVDIKRKDGLGDWVALNEMPILPGISVKNNYSNAEADPAEASRIKGKLLKMLAAGKVKEISPEEYVKKLDDNDRTIVSLNDMMAHDYDVALLCGFAFIDHSVTDKSAYEYGVFTHGTNKLLDTAIWDYGEIPDLNVVTDITSKGTGKSTGLQLIWNADINKMKSGDVAGFNIYRQGIRLNQTPITSTNDNDPSEFVWNDKLVNTANPSQYSISAESIFGIEGIIKPYVYNPAEHPQHYAGAETKEVISLGFYFKEGISIKWSFPPEDEKFLKGFYLEKNNLPNGYKRIGQLLDPMQRSYIDKTPSPASSYIAVRVVAVYKDKTVVTGHPRIYSYFPVIQPAAPQNLKIEHINEDKKAVIKLAWDRVFSGDSITTAYKVYIENPTTGRFVAVNEDVPVYKNSYTYTIDHGYAYRYRFYVTAIARTGRESNPSDTLSAEVPSLELPAPVIKNAFSDGKTAVVQWEYTYISDLKGFRLYQDKQLLADEKVLTTEKREFRTQGLSKGQSVEFTLIAVSATNVESPSSVPARVTMASGKK